MYISSVALGACGGCEASLLAAGEPLVALLSEHDIGFSSLLVDRRTLTPSDVVLVSGCVRNSEERRLAEEVARTSRKIIAVGTCAVYGGVAGLRRLELEQGEDDDVLPRVFGEAEPLDQFMSIELYVPGCPPPTPILFETVKAVLEGTPPERYDTTVCSDCDRRVIRKGPARAVSLRTGPAVSDDACLLNQGLLCAGPVTRGGCEASCPSAGVVCAGCRGPSDAILSSQLHSLYSDMVSFVTRTTGGRREKVAAQLDAMLDVIYSYTARDPVAMFKVRGKVPRG
ncbi:MAG TPA: hypothetical protein VIK15_00270 [Candidatus Anoxymicrobiaceae bacterium]